MKIQFVAVASLLMYCGTGVVHAETQPHKTAKHPTFKVYCQNTVPSGPQKTKFQVMDNTLTLEKIQFNINMPATAGAYFVDAHNLGECVAEISKGYRFVSGTYDFDPAGTSVVGNSSPKAVENGLTVVALPEDKNSKMRYSVRTNGTAVGNVMLKFSAKFERAR